MGVLGDFLVFSRICWSNETIILKHVWTCLSSLTWARKPLSILLNTFLSRSFFSVRKPEVWGLFFPNIVLCSVFPWFDFIKDSLRSFKMLDWGSIFSEVLIVVFACLQKLPLRRTHGSIQIRVWFLFHCSYSSVIFRKKNTSAGFGDLSFYTMDKNS